VYGPPRRSRDFIVDEVLGDIYIITYSKIKIKKGKPVKGSPGGKEKCNIPESLFKIKYTIL